MVSYSHENNSEAQSKDLEIPSNPIKLQPLAVVVLASFQLNDHHHLLESLLSIRHPRGSFEYI